MRRLLAAVRSELGGGRFLTAWSLATTLPLSLTVMAPFGAGVDLRNALSAAFATWLCFAAGVTAVAVVERRARLPRTRALTVIAGVLACAVLRPLVQDLWAGASGLTIPPGGQLPFRIATNILVWAVVFSVVAVLEGSLRTLRNTNALLRSVASELAKARAHAHAFGVLAQKTVAVAASELGHAVRRLDATAAAVRELGATGFRAWSHRLRALSAENGTGDDAPLARTDPASGASAGGEPAPTRRRLPIRLPEKGLVTVVYGAIVLPYALHSVDPLALLVGLVALVGGGAVIDGASRARALARRPRARPAAFLVLSAAMGLGLSALAIASGIPMAIAAVSAVVYLAFALASGLCAGALHAQRREQRRLSGAIAGAQRGARENTRPVREGLRRASELLHRDGQGECTVFALAYPAPTPDDIDRLQRTLGDTIAGLPSAFASARGSEGGAEALTALTDTWRRVIALHVEIPDAAWVALSSAPWAARDAYDLVAEGLLNAVKHGAERRAEVAIAIIATGAGPRLRVRVRSFGPVAAGAHLRPASHARDLGARLVATPGGAVLEAVLPLPAHPVVSAEHPAERPQRQP